MKAGSYFLILLLAVACGVLTVVLIIVASNNQQLQAKWQAQQQVLNQGVLGPQAQQVSTSVYQDMANAGVDDPAIRQLLDKYNIRVQPSQSVGPLSRPSEEKGNESAKPEASKS